MKVVLPGGSGQVGQILARAYRAEGHDVVIIGRDGPVVWDGRTLGPWATELDGADLVVNLAGRSVDCRYTDANLRAMMDSRVDSTRVVGEAIAAADNPPPVWMQMSTATIYAHTFGRAHDETGAIGGDEPDVPDYWEYSVRIARNWEQAQLDADTPATRRLQLRAAMVMSPDPGGVFSVLSRLARFGLGGPVAGGKQYVSWIHEHDFVGAVRALHDADLDGPVNLASPGPLPYADFMRVLRHAWGRRLGLPATKWMLSLGAFALRSDPELVLKSRRVVSERLQTAGFEFLHPAWPAAAQDLVRRARNYD